MSKTKAFLSTPHLWASAVMLALSLMILGWTQSYPVSYSPAEAPVLDQVSPLFWTGLVAGFVGLAGLVLTSKSPYAHWLAACLFVLFLSAPQFLYISWGSDAGALPDLVEYARSIDRLDMSRDVAVHSYFQWPGSILFHSLLADVLGVDVHTAIQIGFIFVAVAIGGGLFTLWLDALSTDPKTTRAAFWGLVLYFAGFYWLLNWQAVPYTFSLALFFPLLAWLGRRTWQEKGLLLLFFLVGIESHALFGLWSIALVAMLLVLRTIARRNGSLLSLLLLLVVGQAAVTIYKNTRFFEYLVHSLQGTYQALLEMGASDRALVRQISTALSPLPAGPVGAILKALSWFDLASVSTAFAVATFVVIRQRLVKWREVALLGAGSLHFLLGIVLAAIGTRSLQLVGMVPAFFAVEAMTHGGKSVRKALRLTSVIALLLFPAAIIRSHQTSTNFVKPSNLLVKEYLAGHATDLPAGIAILDEGRIHATDRLSLQVYNPRTAMLERCKGPYLLVDTLQFRRYAASVADSPLAEMGTRLDRLDLSTFYTNGTVTLGTGPECQAWDRLWK
ncbi:MAG: hypothetical protein M8467_18425 [Anaerolineae bacterium]|nr:hypothetical protein [Anaerolineae bacterium]